jgi:hypothetical protein
VRREVAGEREDWSAYPLDTKSGRRCNSTYAH